MFTEEKLKGVVAGLVLLVQILRLQLILLWQGEVAVRLGRGAILLWLYWLCEANSYVVHALEMSHCLGYRLAVQLRSFRLQHVTLNCAEVGLGIVKALVHTLNF